MNKLDRLENIICTKKCLIGLVITIIVIVILDYTIGPLKPLLIVLISFFTGLITPIIGNLFF